MGQHVSSSHRHWTVEVKRGWRGVLIAIPELRLAFKVFPRENMSAALREAETLRMLQGVRGIPRLYAFVREPVPILVREYIPGTPISDFIERASESELKHVIEDLLRVSLELDRRGIVIEELSTMRDNVIVSGGRVWLVDLEQRSLTTRRSNVTEVLSWLAKVARNPTVSNKLKRIINVDKLISVAREYKAKRDAGVLAAIFKDESSSQHSQSSERGS